MHIFHRLTRSSTRLLLRQVLEGQFAIKQELNLINQKLLKMSATLDQLLQDVNDETTLENSLITLTQGIKAQLDAILAGNLPADVQAKVDSLFSQVEANKLALTNAIAANTASTTP